MFRVGACFINMPRRQYILEPEYCAVAEKMGIEFVGPLPKNTSSKTTWRCRSGHEWKAAYWNVIRGSGALCRICMTPKTCRLTDADYAERGRLLGFEYLGPLPKYTTEKTNWRCIQGHIWSACLHFITSCPDCRRVQPAEYFQISGNSGISWIGPYPKTIEHKTNWVCGSGHIFSDSYANIRDWPDCPICAIGRVSVQDYMALAQQRGIELIGNIPKTSKHKTEWRCERGHLFYTSYQILKMSKNGNGCMQCSNISRIGINNPNWTGGSQDECASNVITAIKLARRRD